MESTIGTQLLPTEWQELWRAPLGLSYCQQSGRSYGEHIRDSVTANRVAGVMESTIWTQLLPIEWQELWRKPLGLSYCQLCGRSYGEHLRDLVTANRVTGAMESTFGIHYCQ